ncbi:S-adenosyl-L-methionine-dependent methyltransferase [Piptocephalis cylindrospora]|uniref:S-adenosyl-L-methionine-dependent methyltransferase n=1 Tax=Piptocephalis cylindrospora TaxID=1907219 RepID=A0A4P9Y3E7_9FUNG|nr:S-adenosyl-L-methionine-dependent methyltransferase [Piptocephalis cylindrospora]|eukprot:RKP13214.1 S-adenosyl-L-methionine-dependent methyltransferase [Piptocephalis cylindrospora]
MSSINKPQPKAIRVQEEEAASAEASHVQAVYEDIAQHFSATRYKPWPVVERFLGSLPAGSLGADVGCGNGKYLGVRPDLVTLGSDRCKGLVQVCRERGFEAAIADNLELPYRPELFDFCLSIAVIHHFASEERRVAALVALLRLLRPGGKLLVFVWALEQKGKRNFSADEPDVLVPWVIPSSLKSLAKKEEGSQEDATEKVHQRYYHLFQQGELPRLTQQAFLACPGAFTLQEEGYDRDNWFVIVERQVERV